jgi:hypothetical protein
MKLANLTAAAVHVEIFTFDSQGQPQSQATLDLGQFDSVGTGGIPPGTYRFVFHGATPDASDPQCDFAVAPPDAYQFVILPSGIAIARVGQPPAGGADLMVPTSSLCHAQP